MQSHVNAPSRFVQYASGEQSCWPGMGRKNISAHGGQWRREPRGSGLEDGRQPTLRALVCVDRKCYRRDRDEQYHEDQAAHADADQPREVRLVAPIPLRGRDLLADLIDGLLPAWPGLPLRGALLPHQRGPRAADQALVIVDTKDANVCMLHAHSSQSSSRRHYGSWMGAPTTELVVRPCGQSGLPATAAA